MNQNSCLNLKGITLKESQKQIAQYIRNPQRRGLLVFHETGSGKTLAALAAIRCFLKDNPRGNAFIITPTSVTEQFKKVLKDVGMEDLPISIWPHVTFVNRYREGTIDMKNSILVVDEAHVFANLPSATDMAKEKSQKVRSVQIFKACRTAKKVLLMTATPSVNLARQIYSYLSYIEGQRKTPKRSIVQMHQDAKCHVSYYQRKVNDPNYPEKKIYIKTFTMNKDYLNVYNRVEVQVQRDLKAQGFNPQKNQKAFMTAVRRASNRVKGHENPKIQWLVEQIQKDPTLPRVIYSSWLSAGIHYVQEKLKQLGVKFHEITGKVTKMRRQAISEDFNQGKMPILFITAAGAEGLDLRGVREIYIVEPHWTHSRHQQVIGRGVRFQSHNHLPLAQRKVDVYYLALRKPDFDQEVFIGGTRVDFFSADDRVMMMCYIKGQQIVSLYDLLAKEDFKTC